MKWGPCGSRCGRGVGRRPHHNGTHTDEADAQRGGGRRGSERLGRFCAMRCTFDVAGDNTVSRLAVPLVLVLDDFLLLRGPQPLQFCKVVLACFLALQLQALLFFCRLSQYFRTSSRVLLPTGCSVDGRGRVTGLESSPRLGALTAGSLSLAPAGGALALRPTCACYTKCNTMCNTSVM